MSTFYPEQFSSKTMSNRVFSQPSSTKARPQPKKKVKYLLFKQENHV